MGTRSRVGVMHGDVCKSVYCHYDGYLEYTGKLLLDNYNSALANQLVARGDNSGVQNSLEGMNFYSDRGEEDVRVLGPAGPQHAAVRQHHVDVANGKNGRPEADITPVGIDA